MGQGEIRGDGCASVRPLLPILTFLTFGQKRATIGLEIKKAAKIKTMAYRQFQTAAARVVHIVEPTDADIDRLADEFHFHPLDLEAVLGVSAEPRVGGYRQYVSASLPWPMIDRRGRHLMTSELQLFIGPDYIVITEDGLQTDIRDTVAMWESQEVNADHPVMLAYDLILQLLKTTSVTSRAIPAAKWAAAITPLVSGLEQFRQRLTGQGWLDHEDNQNAYAYVLYTAKHLLSAVTNQPEAAAPLPLKRPVAQSAVAGYAIASAIMTVVVLLVISFHR